MKRHLGCKAGSHETDHLLSKRLILITPARAAKDLSIKASRTCNSQITLKRPPWAFYLRQLTTNEMHASISPFSSVLRKYQNTLKETKLSVYKKTPLIFSGELGHCGRGSRRGQGTAGVTREERRMAGRCEQAQTALPPRELESFLLLSPRNDLCNPSMEKSPEQWAAPGRFCQASKPSPS